MVWVEGGTFERGAEKQVVTVPDFYIGKYLVTQAVWKSVMKENPARFRGENRPVENISWIDTLKFVNKINILMNRGFRLPSETEWEYAARGGKFNQGLQHAGSNKLKEIGWYRKNSVGQTQPVGLKSPNKLGIYDMNGNLWEWCADHWHKNYEDAPLNGSAWVEGRLMDERVVRGGSWYSIEEECLLLKRYNDFKNIRDDLIGFRIVRN